MHQYQERDEEEDRKPGGKTQVKEIYMESVGVKGGGRTGQEKVEELYSKSFWRPQGKIINSCTHDFTAAPTFHVRPHVVQSLSGVQPLGVVDEATVGPIQ